MAEIFSLTHQTRSEVQDVQTGVADGRRCLYCHGESFRLLYDRVRDRLGFAAGERQFWRCENCGSAVLSPFPKQEELSSYYPPVYSFNPEIGGQGRFKNLLASLEYRFFFRPQYVAQVRGVMRSIDFSATGRRLLDVGCGRGLRLLVFRDQGFDVEGSDFQPDVVEYVRTKVGLKATCTDVKGLLDNYSAKSFDLVTAFYVLEHVTDVAEVLQTSFQLLKPGGWFVGAVPFIDGLQARLFGRRWINVTEAPRHLSLPSHQGIEQLCRQVGFDKILFRPDSVLNCAGMIGSSLLPGAALTDVYGGGKLKAMLLRFVGAGVTLLSVPLCWLENYAGGRPSLGMVIAHKPN